MSKPLVSVCMGTAQTDRPLLHGTDSVYEILRRSVDNQTYKGPIEIVVADADVPRLSREFRSRWGRADRVVLTRQVLHERIAISGARNTAATYARGELIVFVDDCTELLPSFIKTAVDLHKHGKLPTRMLLVGSKPSHAAGAASRRLLRAGAMGTFEFEDPLWIAQGRPTDKTTWKLSGQAGGAFVIDRSSFLRLNGFDENFDGGWGCEDHEFCARLDRLGRDRVSCCDLAIVQWVHRGVPLRATLRRCRELYAQWSYTSERLEANRRLPEEVLDRLRSAEPCSVTCALCKASDRNEQVATYRTFPAEFDLRSLHASNNKRPSGVYLDPWR